jgi:hypothetical protein
LKGEERFMWTMGGGEAALLVFAVAVIGWVRRNVIIEWVQPIKLGPIVIRFRSEQRPSGRSTLAVAEEIPSGGPGRDRKKALEDVQKATGLAPITGAKMPRPTE